MKIHITKKYIESSNMVFSLKIHYHFLLCCNLFFFHFKQQYDTLNSSVSKMFPTTRSTNGTFSPHLQVHKYLAVNKIILFIMQVQFPTSVSYRNTNSFTITSLLFNLTENHSLNLCFSSTVACQWAKLEETTSKSHEPLSEHSQATLP